MTTPTLKQAAHALGGDIAGRNRVLCPGPGHRGNDRSLAVTFTGAGFVVHSFAGDDFRECRDHVKTVLGLGRDAPRAVNDNPPPVDTDRLRKSQDALSKWARSVPLAGTLAETYLASRGLAYGGEALRFYAGGRAMIALMTDAITGEPCGIHCTHLDRDGKAARRPDGSKVKLMHGRSGGAVVRLSPDEDVTLGLGIAEGIETALATGFEPMWACLSAGTMKTLPVLAGIEALTIFADRDHAGMIAANDCGRRWHSTGVEVTISAPPTIGADFADMREAA